LPAPLALREENFGDLFFSALQGREEPSFFRRQDVHLKVGGVKSPSETGGSKEIGEVLEWKDIDAVRARQAGSQQLA
jgi:hypothetical protein